MICFFDVQFLTKKVTWLVSVKDTCQFNDFCYVQLLTWQNMVKLLIVWFIFHIIMKVEVNLSQHFQNQVHFLKAVDSILVIYSWIRQTSNYSLRKWREGRVAEYWSGRGWSANIAILSWLLWPHFDQVNNHLEFFDSFFISSWRWKWI